MNTDKLYKFNWVRMATMLLAIVGIVACSDEELINGTLKEGTPVTVNFQFSVPAQDLVISSRAIDEETANKVTNLYVLGFKPDGSRAFGYYYDTELGNGKNTVLNAKEKIAAGTYDIYAVANIDSDVYGIDSNTDNTGSDNLKSFLDEVPTKDALLTKTVSILTSAQSLDRSGASLLMAGALCDKDGNAISATISTDGQTVSTINLKRLDSEITFNFKKGANVSFAAKRWYIVNAPAKSRLVEDNTVDGATESDDFFHTYKEKEEDRTPVYNNTFTFYMPENRKKAKNEDLTDYHDREREITNSDGKHDVSPDNQRRKYIYAPDYGTYVVVTGHYEGPATSNELGSMPNVVAEVQYIIHLGFVNKVANDFFSKRNTKYTYNVTVRGVDNIIVEVEEKTEKQPGATGDVIFGDGNNVYNLDAHYETVLLTFDYNELVKAWGNGEIEDLFTVVTSTPYTAKTSKPDEDKQWVQVIRNNAASEDFQSYNAVKGQLQSVQSMLDELKYAVANKKPETIFSLKDNKYVVTYTCFVDEFYYEKEDLPTGAYDQLPDKVNIWKSFVNCPNRKMYIICNRQYSPDEESSIVSSKYVISQRAIQTFYSTEPSSEKVIAYGIETLNETGNLRTYGVMASEAGADNRNNGWYNFYLNCKRGIFQWTQVKDHLNGYKNIAINKQVNEFGNKNPEGGTENSSNYLRAMEETDIIDLGPARVTEMTLNRACLQRNRHEADGSSIESSDVKWYLPSINQYQSFYLGEPAISQESRLFDYPYSNQYITSSSYQFIQHYASSTYATTENANSVYLFWAEEATSVSTKAQQYEWATTGSSKNNAEAVFLKRMAFRYRCMRSLGADDANNDGKYTPYSSIIGNPKERVTIKVDHLNPLLRSRGRTTGELGPHFYQDKGNYFYTNGFETASNDECYTLKTTLNQVTGVEASDESGCAKLNKNLQPGEAKWRAPNLRELTLMWQGGVINDSFAPIIEGASAARTQMPYRYTANGWYRRGWVITFNNMGMSFNNPTTSVRCVRDLK